MSEDQKNSEQQGPDKSEKIVHQLDMNEGDLPRRKKKYKKKYRKKELYRKKPNVRRKIKKRWLNNKKNLTQVIAVAFLILPLLIAMIILADQKFHFIPWHYFNFLFTIDPEH